MSSQLETDLLQAGLDLLRLDPTLKTQDGEVEDGTLRPYVLVYGWTDRPRSADANALDGLSRTINIRWYLHCLGETRESASVMARRASDQLLDKRLTVAGYPTVAIDSIEQESALEPTRDQSTSQAVFDAVCVYKARATL